MKNTRRPQAGSHDRHFARVVATLGFFGAAFLMVWLIPFAK